jgi:hypothetical protein
MLKEITHEDWVNIKREMRLPRYRIVPATLLAAENGASTSKFPEAGCTIGNDLCVNVPEFICDQRMRIRTKIHSRKNNKGFCVLSVIIACQPKNIKKKKIQPGRSPNPSS